LIVAEGKGVETPVERSAKQAVVDTLRGELQKSTVAIVCGFQGIKVSEVDSVRRQLRAQGIKYQVVKNTLAALAMDGTPMRNALEPHLKGSTALVWASEDPSAPSKVLNKLVKDIGALKIKAGYLDGRTLNATEVEALASMPGKQELRGMLVCLFVTPATNFVRVLSTSGPGAKFVRLLEARRKALAGE
jgi:large subunit ribosomal protein L10